MLKKKYLSVSMMLLLASLSVVSTLSANGADINDSLSSVSARADAVDKNFIVNTDIFVGNFNPILANRIQRRDAASNPSLAPSDWFFERSSVALNDAILDEYPGIDTNGDGFISISEANAHTGYILLPVSNISGTINGIEHFTSVRRIFLAGNQLSGVIPSSLGNLTNLEILRLYYNHFTSISPSIYTFITSIDGRVQSQMDRDDLLPIGTVESPYEFDGLSVYEQLPNYGVTFEYNLEYLDGTETIITPTILNGKVTIDGALLTQNGNYSLVATGTSGNSRFTDFVYTTNFSIANRVQAKDLTVKYQDTDSNEISADKIVSGNSDDSYDVSTAEYNLAIDGHTFKEVQGQTTGRLSDQAQTVTYLYTRNSVRTRTLLVKYENAAGDTLADTQIISGQEGDSYDVSNAKYKLEIDSHTLKEVRGETTGRFTDEGQVVTYVYAKKGTSPLPTTAHTTLVAKNAPVLPHTGDSQNVFHLMMGILVVILSSLLSWVMLGKKFVKESK